ncbi:MAG: hypothetical protein IT428_30600 [Planctomycetaceae bacterium]|nr:hypothetical protein [Planctomycetaceae bacterium]
MLATLLDELTGKGAGVILGLILGSLIGWISARWKRYRERQSILQGDARDTVVIHQHLVESTEGPDGKRRPTVLRLRSLGQSQLDRVIPNGHLAGEMLRRAFRVTPSDTLISMESRMRPSPHSQ